MASRKYQRPSVAQVAARIGAELHRQPVLDAGLEVAEPFVDGLAGHRRTGDAPLHLTVTEQRRRVRGLQRGGEPFQILESLTPELVLERLLLGRELRRVDVVVTDEAFVLCSWRRCGQSKNCRWRF